MSIDSLLADYQRQQDYANLNAETNLLFSKKQAAENIKGMRADAISRVNGVRNYIPSPVQKPNLLGTIFDTTTKVAIAASPLFGDKGQIARYKEKTKPKL